MHRTHAVARPNLRKVIAVVTATLIAVSLAVVPAADAGAPPDELHVTLSEDATAETFDVEIDLGLDTASCATTEYTLTDAGSDEEFDVDVVDGEDNLTGSFAADHLDPGAYDLEVVCEHVVNGDGAGDLTLNDVFVFSRVTVDKQVEGEVPEDTSFLVRAACEVVMEEGASWTVDVDFDGEGGTQNLLVEFNDDGPSVLCIVSEPEDGGADSTEFDNAELEMEGPSSETTTVTNTFPEEEPEPEEEEEEAEPAEPVEEEPDFTG